MGGRPFLGDAIGVLCSHLVGAFQPVVGCENLGLPLDPAVLDRLRRTYLELEGDLEGQE